MFKRVSGLCLIMAIGSVVLAAPSYASVWSNANGSSISVGVSESGSYGGGPAKVVHKHRSRQAASPCTYTLLTKVVDDPTVPSIPPGQYFMITCVGENLNLVDPEVVYVPFATEESAAASTGPNTVATEAADSISLPQPVIQMNPESFSVVNFGDLVVDRCSGVAYLHGHRIGWRCYGDSGCDSTHGYVDHGQRPICCLLRTRHSI